MRRHWFFMRVALTVGLGVVASCSSGSTSGPGGDADGGSFVNPFGEAGAGVDGGKANDGATNPETGAPTDAAADTGSASDSGAGACTGTSDCPPASPLCCGHITLGPDAFPNCGIAGTSVACAATCSTFIPSMCSSSLVARYCHASSDCTSSNNNLCCTISALGGVSICANAMVVSQYGGGVCH